MTKTGKNIVKLSHEEAQKARAKAPKDLCFSLVDCVRYAIREAPADKNSELASKQQPQPA